MRIESIGAGGDGIAQADGVRVFVPYAAPGDVARIEARGERGRLIELVEAGPDRVAPPCPHYGACGGCALQHVSDEFQRKWKRDRVCEALARAGLSDASVDDALVTPAASRRRATFAVRKGKGGVALGFNMRGSTRIEPISSCLVLHKDISNRLPALKALAAAVDAPNFDLSATACRNGLDIGLFGARLATPRGAALQRLADGLAAAGGVRLSLNAEILLALEQPVVTFDDLGVAIPPGAFLQASEEGEALLLGLVREAVGESRKIADLFCGCGAFALPLAKTSSLYAADSNGPAVAALADAAGRAQAAGLGVNPVCAEARDLFERPLTPKELSTFDAVVFDPPRAGAKAQAEALAASSVRRVAAVSCNPSTFARDAAILVAGGFRLTRATPVDQFVHSPHVELVAAFARD